MFLAHVEGGINQGLDELKDVYVVVQMLASQNVDILTYNVETIKILASVGKYFVVNRNMRNAEETN